MLLFLTDEFQRKLEKDQAQPSGASFEPRKKEKQEKQEKQQQGRSDRHHSGHPSSSINKESIWGLDTEDWDAEGRAGGYTAAYDPTQKLSQDSHKMLYQPGGLSKSERKQYRAEQRLKATASVLDQDSVVDVNNFGRLSLETKNTKQEESKRCHESESESSKILSEKVVCAKDVEKLEKEIEKKVDEDFGDDPFG
jgi:hypothetical protein